MGKSWASRARDVALFGYALIRSLADPALSPAQRGALARELAWRVHQGPFGEPVTVSVSDCGGLGPGGGAPAVFGRFEADAPEQLWVTDGLHAPDHRRSPAVLFALLG